MLESYKRIRNSVNLYVKSNMIPYLSLFHVKAHKKRKNVLTHHKE